jgi:UDP-N-acetyl-D-glucosamine dehydrogenase
MKTSVVGLGYVGLPLSLQFARSGVLVLGLDTDPEKVALLNASESYIRHIDSAAVTVFCGYGFNRVYIPYLSY